jgi:hypothetical protein
MQPAAEGAEPSTASASGGPSEAPLGTEEPRGRVGRSRTNLVRRGPGLERKDGVPRLPPGVTWLLSQRAGPGPSGGTRDRTSHSTRVEGAELSDVVDVPSQPASASREVDDAPESPVGARSPAPSTSVPSGGLDDLELPAGHRRGPSRSRQPSAAEHEQTHPSVNGTHVEGGTPAETGLKSGGRRGRPQTKTSAENGSDSGRMQETTSDEGPARTGNTSPEQRRVELEGMTVRDGLRGLCREYGLVQRGLKAELVERILRHEHPLLSHPEESTRVLRR